MSLYKVGEEVILQSIKSPQLNGDAVVLEVLTSEENAERFERIAGVQVMGSPGRGYILDISVPARTQNGVHIPSGARLWDESALRKKYKPGWSFEKLMDALQHRHTHDA